MPETAAEAAAVAAMAALALALSRSDELVSVGRTSGSQGVPNSSASPSEPVRATVSASASEPVRATGSGAATGSGGATDSASAAPARAMPATAATAPPAAAAAARCGRSDGSGSSDVTGASGVAVATPAAAPARWDTEPSTGRPLCCNSSTTVSLNPTGATASGMALKTASGSTDSLPASRQVSQVR